MRRRVCVCVLGVSLGTFRCRCCARRPAIAHTTSPRALHPHAAPTLHLVGGNDVVVQAGHTYVDPGIRAADSVDGDLSDTVVVSGTVNTNALGVYTLVYTVSNTVGLVATASRRVTVADTEDGCAPKPCGSAPGTTCADQIGGYTCSCGVTVRGPRCSIVRTGSWSRRLGVAALATLHSHTWCSLVARSGNHHACGRRRH